MSPQRRALITGGASGIGLGIAKAMVEAGYHVTVTGLTLAETAAVRQSSHLSAIQLDVTSAESVAAAVEPFEELAALVNCAGILIRGGAEYEIETFQRVIDVNLTGTMRMCVAARPKLARMRGAIVNTASMLSYFGGPLVPAYTASKGGVAQLTKALAAGWAADGIRVNAIAPGWIATGMTRSLIDDESRSAAILGRTPLGRWGEPADIGGAVVFLCSEAARFITGTILNVDGGYTAV
ncbi:MAG TPA: SDR family oxidoreductase [Acidobacteriaceae bacterium]|nr:SDR family oxidoreductase [Acidobacteriaceae bacterium]